MKRIVCLCILAALCFGVLTIPAMAAESGSCGDNVTWKLEDGILTISGSGEMTHAPWLEQKNQITDIVIEDGVTSVCDGAFDGYEKLLYVTVSDSVTQLGEKAFANCSGLRMMFFYGDKPVIGSQCFANTGATVYHYSDNKTWPSGSIAKYMECMRTDYATSGIWGDNITWKYADNVLTFSGVGVMKGYSAQDIMPWEIFANQATKVVFEPGITHIANYTLICFIRVNEVSIPNTVTSISWGAFSGCNALKNVTLPDGLEKIGDTAFKDCASLETISIPASVWKIGGDVFLNCTSLKTIYFYGDEPLAHINESLMYPDALFTNVTATAYYPIGNATWTEEDFKDYGGNITWTGFCANRHTEKIVEAKAPSCTTTGLTEGKVCKNCGEVLQAQEVIPATDHIFGEWEEIKAATTEETGLAERKCENCDATEQRELDKLAPLPTEPTQVPTDAPTEPAQLPTDPTQPDITITEDPKPFPWAIVVIAVAAVGAAAAGVILGKKRK